MNQKHMDSISLGIHMGLKTKGAGENAFGEEHFRSHQTPCICKQQFEVCDDCVLGWVSFPNNRIYRMSRSSLTNVSREQYPSAALPCPCSTGPQDSVMASQVEVRSNMGPLSSSFFNDRVLQ